MRWSGTSASAMRCSRCCCGACSGVSRQPLDAFRELPAAAVRAGAAAARATGRRQLDVGHSPSGALSVFALLAALRAQVAAGLLSWDDIVQIGGPLNRHVSEAAASRALWFHKAVGQWLVIGLVLLHVSAVLFYLLARRLDLVRPMWHGDKRLADASLAAVDDAAMRWRALALMALSAAGVAARRLARLTCPA